MAYLNLTEGSSWINKRTDISNDTIYKTLAMVDSAVEYLYWVLKTRYFKTMLYEHVPDVLIMLVRPWYCKSGIINL